MEGIQQTQSHESNGVSPIVRGRTFIFFKKNSVRMMGDF